MSDVLVSVVIPYFNKKDTIIRSINGVIDQTYTNWELIIIDDCGEDQLDITTLPKDERISILFNESNRGAAQTRQRGLENSKGAYIAFLDADDWWAPSFLEKSLEVHSADGDLLMTWTERIRVSQNGEVTVDLNSKLDHQKLRETIIKFRRPWQTGGLLWKKGKTTKWNHLDLNEDMLFEINNCTFGNKIRKVHGHLFFQGFDSGYSLSMKFEDFTDERTKFICWINIWKNQRKHLTFSYKVILILRMVKYFYKKSKNENKKLKYIFFSLIFKIGQKTKYRVHY